MLKPSICRQHRKKNARALTVFATEIKRSEYGTVRAFAASHGVHPMQIYKLFYEIGSYKRLGKEVAGFMGYGYRPDSWHNFIQAFQ